MWGYGRSYGASDVEAAFQVSLAARVDLFDTAEVYGRGLSERLLVRVARATGQPVVLATKFMPYPWRLVRDSLPRALRGSLARLGVERVDLYQVYWPLPTISVESWVQALAVAAGFTRAAGVSNYGLEQMRRSHWALAKRGVGLASNQVRYSLLDRTPERSGLVAASREHDVTPIAYSSLAQGLLTGKYTLSIHLPGPLGCAAAIGTRRASSPSSLSYRT
jgi:aryl-alcohol dehydrogenase-like predicted oxidoreductase